MTLDLPEPLIEEACRLAGTDSATAAVILALQDLVRRGNIEELKSLFGAIHLAVDIDESRRR
jgi:Arc/MetJ family transcription regulator